ncbi:MAG: hypothetical protein WBW47_07525 [Thermoplasmata archaeon]
MRWTVWGTLPYFLAGVAVGIFVDRVLGGPAGASGLATVVSAIAAAFALSGPLLQEHYHQSHDDERLLRQERQEHAVEIADTTLRWLGSATFRPDTASWRPDPGSELDGLLVQTADSGPPSVESLQYWVFALDHMKADPAIAPDWASLSASLRKRRDLKSELDQWTALRLRETIGATFGSGFVPGRGYMLPPPATRFYDPNATLGHLRGPVDVGSFTFQSQPYSAGPEGPSGTRDSISYGPNVLIGTTETGLLEVGKYRTMYLGLRNDPLFRIKLASVEDLDEEVAKATARFASAAFQYFERVRGSKSLLGTCALCPKFED